MEVFTRLAEVEKRFEALEVDTLRTSYIKSKPIYNDRAGLIKQVPGFWSQVLQSDEVPAAIESAIHPCDIPVLDFLTAIEVARYEVDKDSEGGDPRSFTITFEFCPNEFLVDRTLEKTFSYSKNQDGATGLATEAVEIGYTETPQGSELAKCVARSESFFAFFRYRCGSVSKVKANRHMEVGSLNGEGGLDISLPKTRPKEFDGDLESMLQRTSSPNNDDDDDNNLLATEAFPPGEDIAIAISEDVYPNALKYFTQAREQEISDSDDDESDEERTGDSEGSSEVDENPPKRQRK